MFVLILILYAVAMVLLGLYVSRRVHEATDFFVAGRNLGAGLLFSTFLAANIGAGSTVGAAGLGYRDGYSAWWWVGSAGVGSLILALAVGPRIWKVAKDNNLFTVGDYLEFRFDKRVKSLVAILLWFGSLAILAAQLIAIAWILNAVLGVDKPIGCAIGAVIATTYFAMGGLHSTARVNVLQLTVKLIGFTLAFMYVSSFFHPFTSDPSSLTAAGIDPSRYLSIVGDGSQPLRYLILLVPSFFVSPGLLQKVFGARDARAVRAGVGLNAICLLAFAIIPMTLGVTARYQFPHLVNHELALPTLMTQGLPLWIGGLLLGATFAAELSSADAVLFMLSTSLSKDLYKTFINPSADDRQLMGVVRRVAVGCGVIGGLLAAILPDVISALTIFYTLLSAALFLPLIAGLYSSVVTARGALMAMGMSVAVTIIVDRVTHGAGYGGAPALIFGIAAGSVAMLCMTLTERMRR